MKNRLLRLVVSFLLILIIVFQSEGYYALGYLNTDVRFQPVNEEELAIMPEDGEEPEHVKEPGRESDSGSESVSEDESVSEGESESESDPGSEDESDSENESDSEDESESDPEDESESESESDPEGESDSEKESESANESEPESEAESGHEPESESESLPEDLPDQESTPAVPEGSLPLDQLGQVPREFTGGSIVIDNIEYWCYTNGEASIRNGKKATGDLMIPAEITGPDGESYLVTKLEGYMDGGMLKGSFENSAITGLSFEEGSQLWSIGHFAFAACYGLVGTSVVIPDTVTWMGDEVFFMYHEDPGIAEIRHRHVAAVEGELPDLKPDHILEVPDAAQGYESTVNSSEDTAILHKGASWTNPELTEAEIRIDYGDSQKYRGEMDIVFVLDYSNSMLLAADATDKEGNVFRYSRSFLTNDVVSGVGRILLESGIEGYDNRVAMIAFGSEAAPVWSADFTGNAAEVEETLFHNPLTLANGTNYGAGLQGAIDLINSREDKSRKAAVIFLSDGVPNKGYGTNEAKTLRSMGVNVYPIATYTSVSDYLRAISYDGKTAYNAADSSSFQDIIMEVVDGIFQVEAPLAITLVDVLSEHFEFATGTAADVTVSQGGGTAAIDAENLIWDLAGTAADTVHNIRIKVRLKQGTELSATGVLPTNLSLGAEDGSIASSLQPELSRYLVHHEFKNDTVPDLPLPDEVMNLLPASTGGFREQSLVTPTAPEETEVELAGGEKWEFTRWEAEEMRIEGADVTFTGFWRRSDLAFAFIKTDQQGKPLADVSFDLYYWRGETAPDGDAAYIEPDEISGSRWEKVNAAAIKSEADGTVRVDFREAGIYQLVETETPGGFYLPDSQWRLEVGSDYVLKEPVTIPGSETAILVTDMEKVTVDGAAYWTLANFRKTRMSLIKLSGRPVPEGQPSDTPLEGAEFQLYLWKSDDLPSDTQLVDAESIRQGLWQLVGSGVSSNGGRVGFDILTGSNQRYQLVEVQAPVNYHLPGGQWRIVPDAGGVLDQNSMMRIPGPDGKYPPELKYMEAGAFSGELVLFNNPVYLLPATGGMGSVPFTAAGLALLLLAGMISRINILLFRKKNGGL